MLDWAGTIIDHGSRAPVEAFREIFRRRDVTISVDEARAPMGMEKRDHISPGDDLFYDLGSDKGARSADNKNFHSRLFS